MASATDPTTTAATDGFCTCDGDPRIDVTCGIYRHRSRARAQMNLPPPPNPLLGATVDDEPAVPLVATPTATAASDDGDMRWWNPASVVREATRRKQAGVCPTCQHPPHRDTTCAVCAGACPYPKTYDAARSRQADAWADFGETLRASVERLFRHGR